MEADLAPCHSDHSLVRVARIKHCGDAVRDVVGSTGRRPVAEVRVLLRGRELAVPKDRSEDEQGSPPLRPHAREVVP